MTYWANFIKYEDPNFSGGSKSERWESFVSDANTMSRMSAEEKMHVAKYLLFANEGIKMSSGLLEHKCAYWNYTVDSNYGTRSSSNCNASSLFVFVLVVNIFRSIWIFN